MAQLSESETQTDRADTKTDDWVEFGVFEPVATGKNYPFFPKEVLPNFDLFRTGNPIYISASDYYIPLLYDGMKLRLQSPVLFIPFPIQTYRNKGATIDKYSLQLSLQSHTPE